MAQLNLDAQKIEETYGVIRKVAYGNIKELLDQLAAVVMPISDDSDLAAELLENCRKATTIYNDQYLPGLQDTIKEYEKVVDVAEYMQKKATTGSIAQADPTVKTANIDADAIKI